jgi:hypothetical protein
VLGMLILLLGVLAGGAFLPLTLSTFAYAWVEKKHRRRWAGLPLARVHVDGGPYRGSEIVPARHPRAPALVRFAAVSCFYWSWFSAVAWVGVGVCAPQIAPFALVPIAGVAVALVVGRAGVRLLRRDAGAPASARRAALLAVVHALLLAGPALWLADPEWSGAATLFAALAALQAGLLALSVRRHAPLFAHAADAGASGRPVPHWLPRVLARQAQRRANFLASASQTMPGA